MNGDYCTYIYMHRISLLEYIRNNDEVEVARKQEWERNNFLFFCKLFCFIFFIMKTFTHPEK